MVVEIKPVAFIIILIYIHITHPFYIVVWVYPEIDIPEGLHFISKRAPKNTIKNNTVSYSHVIHYIINYFYIFHIEASLISSIYLRNIATMTIYQVRSIQPLHR